VGLLYLTQDFTALWIRHEKLAELDGRERGGGVGGVSEKTLPYAVNAPPTVVVRQDMKIEWSRVESNRSGFT
jgi:hypothetical protein